ncbi:MAG: hypothetical protein ACTHJW_13265 [Streptosporangiaceae bacterium]
MSSLGRLKPGSKSKISIRRRSGLAATITAVAAVLGTGCATAGSAGAGHSPASLAPSPAATGAWSAPAGGGAESFSAVAALGESDAWVVGWHTPLPTGIYPLAEHWDGEHWRAVPCPSPGSPAEPTRSSLAAVAIDAPDDAWAVGQWSPIEHVPPSYPLIEHWNGTTWTVVPAPNSGGHVTALYLTAVAAISPTAAWAIGEGVADGDSVPVFMGWNGTRWRYLPSPFGDAPGGPLAGGLAAISARDIWLVGEGGGRASKYQTPLEHWNGSKWTIVPAPMAYQDQRPNIGLDAVGGSSSGNAWAVGWYQTGPSGRKRSTLIEHWDGTRWQLQPSPNGPPGDRGEHRVIAIAALSSTSALAVGRYGARPLTERWNGVRWTNVPNKLLPGVKYVYLNSVAAVDPRFAWAIGEGTHGSIIEKWDGTSWHQLPSPKP